MKNKFESYAAEQSRKIEQLHRENAELRGKLALAYEHIAEKEIHKANKMNLLLKSGE